MLIAQISDLHLRADGTPVQRRFDSQKALAACIKQLSSLDPQPDVVLATGDLADEGRSEDYAVLRQAFDTLAIPVYVIPGNHDSREPLRAAFADRGHLPAEGEFLHYTVEPHPVRLIGLDTVIPGEDGGRMCPARLQWLDDRLAEQPSRPTLIFMHHPPFRTGISFMDRPAFDGTEDLAMVVARHPQVCLIVCGHVHRSIHTGWAGTVASIAPSTIFQVALKLKGDTPSALSDEPPALALHLWRDGSGFVSHTRVISD